MSKYPKLVLPALAIAGMQLGGCASHLITSGKPDGVCAAGECTRAQTSVLGSSVASSNSASGAVATECSGNGLRRVEVKRDFAQGLASVLTLGAVNPATISYACVKPPTGAQFECNFLPGTADADTLDYIACTRKSAEGVEAATFTCKALPAEDDPAKIGEFSCKPDSETSLHVPLLFKGEVKARG